MRAAFPLSPGRARGEKAFPCVSARERLFCGRNESAAGTVKFRYGDVGEYDQSKDFETDWIMYRRALSEVFDCEIKPLSLDYDGTLRPYYVRIELYLEGE